VSPDSKPTWWVNTHHHQTGVTLVTQEDHMCGKPGCAECGMNGSNRVGIATIANPPPAQGIGHSHPHHIPTREDVSLAFQVELSKYVGLLKDKAFDHTHPVDDYAPQGSFANNVPVAGSTISLNIPTDYDMPVRYEGIHVVIPAGALTVTLQLGQRLIPVRTADATADPGQTEPATFSFTFTGMILNSDDLRVLTVTYGAGAAGQVFTMPFVSLTGWVLTRGQFS
jgi:hypothetical protein